MKGKRQKAKAAKIQTYPAGSEKVIVTDGELQKAVEAAPWEQVIGRTKRQTDALQVRYPRIGWGWWLVEILADALRVRRRAPVTS